MVIRIGLLDAVRYVQYIILFLNRTRWYDAKFENLLFFFLCVELPHVSCF